MKPWRRRPTAAASARTGSGRCCFCQDRLRSLLLLPRQAHVDYSFHLQPGTGVEHVACACRLCVSGFAFRVSCVGADVCLRVCAWWRGCGVDPIKSGVTAAGYRISAKEEVTLSSLTQEVRSPGRMQQCTIGVRKASRSSVLPRHAQRQRLLPRHAQRQRVLPRHAQRQRLSPRHAQQQRVLPRYAQQQERLNV